MCTGRTKGKTCFNVGFYFLLGHENPRMQGAVIFIELAGADVLLQTRFGCVCKLDIAAEFQTGMGLAFSHIVLALLPSKDMSEPLPFVRQVV